MGERDDAVAALWAEVRPQQVELARELHARAVAVERDPDDEASWSRVRALTHRLAGTLGSFGQRTAGDAAVSLEELTGGVERPDPPLVARVVSLADALRRTLELEDD